MRRIVWRKATTSPMQREWRFRRVLVVDNIRLEIAAVTSSRAIESPARQCRRSLWCVRRRPPRRVERRFGMRRRYRHPHDARQQPRVGRREGESTIHPDIPNQSLSTIIRRTQIVGSGRARPHRNDPRWRNLIRRSEGLGCVRGGGSSGKGFSRSAITYAAHNTIFTRRGPAGRWPPRAR
jgi:hypothetical protein